jgi:eukaryotic translation initiation factor 2C
MLDAFKRVQPGTGPKNKPYRPALTIIICGKRHHAKFWPTDSQFASNNGNTRPGTVVDKGVTAV